MESTGINSGLTVSMFFIPSCLPRSAKSFSFAVSRCIRQKSVPILGSQYHAGAFIWTFHMNMIQGIYAFFLGMVLGYICEKGGSIYQSILFHMMFNFWGTIISGILPTGNSTLFFVLYLPPE